MSGHIQSAQITIEGFDADNDVLHLPDADQAALGIDAWFDGETGTLYLTGSNLVEDYEQALAYTTFSSYSTGERVLRVHVADVASNIADTGVVLHIIAVNQPPVVTTGMGSIYVSGSATSIPVLPSISVVDSDSPVLHQAVVSLDANSYYPGEDVLTYEAADGITGQFNAMTGQLVLTGEAGLDAWSAALLRVKYRNSQANATPGTRHIFVSVDDGSPRNFIGEAHQRLLVVDGQTTLQSIVVGNLPTETATEINDDGSITLAPDLTLTLGSDALDSVERIEVAITDNYIAGTDFLVLDDLLVDMDASFDIPNGVLTITGDVPLDWYEYVLQGVSYANDSLTHDGLDREISFTVFDGFTNAESQSMMARFEALPAVQSGMDFLVYETGQTSELVDPNLMVVYAGDMLTGATVEFTFDYLDDQDRLLFTEQNGITGSFHETTGVLTLTGDASVEQYATALQSIEYTNTRVNPITSVKELEVIVHDGEVFSDPASLLLIVDTELVAPTVAISTTELGFTEGNAPIPVATDLTIGQHDEAHESGRGTVYLTGTTVFIEGYVPGEDVLTFEPFESEPDENGDTTVIGGEFDAEQGVLYLLGRATLDQYETVLRRVQYENISAAPSTHSRELLISVEQGNGFADAPPITVTVTSLNDPPTQLVAPPAFTTMLQNESFASLGLQEIDYAPPSEQQPFVVVTVTELPDGSLGHVELTGVDAVGVAQVGGTYTLDEIRSAVFVPVLNASGSGTFVFSIAGWNPILDQPDPAHLTESVNIEVLGVEGDFVYDFDHLDDGLLAGQDGWIQTTNGGSMTVTSGVVTASGDNQHVRQTDFGLSGDHVTVTAQVATKNNNGWQFGILHSGGTGAGSDFVFALYDQGTNWLFRSAGLSSGMAAAGMGAAEITSELNNYEVRVEIDLAAPSGNGAAQVYVNDVFVLENTALGLAEAQLDPATWSGIHLRHAGGSTLDSIRLGSGLEVGPGESFVAQVYRDLLGRNPTQEELLNPNLPFDDLADEGLRREVVASIQGSHEYRERVVTDAFQRLLGRAPTQEELAPYLLPLDRVEEFSTDALPSSLEINDYGNPNVAAGISFLNGAATFMASPVSLRTIDTSVVNQDFTAEITVTIPETPAAMGDVTLTELGFTDTPGAFRALTVVGSTAYVGDSTTVRVFDISDPTNITELGSFDRPANQNVFEIEVVGSTAYIANQVGGGVRVLDVSDPANITELGFFDTPASAVELQVVGTKAYVADAQSGLRVLDISDPANIVELGSFNTDGIAQDVEVVGNVAYIGDGDAGLRILDVSDPANIAELGSFDTPGFAWDVEVIGTIAYVADRESGLRILDVSDPANITELGDFNTPGDPIDVEIVGSTAYLAASQGGVRVVDVSDPANMTELVFLDTPGSAGDLQVEGNRVYVADGASGLRIMEVQFGDNDSTPASGYFGLESTDAEGFVHVNLSASGDSTLHGQTTAVGGVGTHRLQFRWDASEQTMVFAIDQDFTGGEFVADHTFDAMTAGPNDNLEHVFFGGAGNASFDDLVIAFDSLPLDAVNNQIVSSDEYFDNRGGESNEGFVQAAFADLLGRDATTQEQTDAVAALEAGNATRSEIVSQIEFSDEGAGIVSERMIGSLLRREITRDELQDLVGLIQEQGIESVLNSVIGSEEYYVLYGVQTSADSRSADEIASQEAELILQWLTGTPTTGNAQVTTGFDAVGTINTDGKAHAGGTLIAPQYVLTAAHLVDGKDIDSLTFSVGLTSYGLQEVHIHPDYAGELLGTNAGNDIAILKLNRPVVDVEPATLWAGDLFTGDELTLVGFGPHPGDDGFGTKRSGTTPIDGLTRNLVTWTYDGADEATTVPGDSGSPQFIQHEGAYYVTSVTSGGTHQALSLGDFAYNTRVDAYADWIDAVTGAQVTRSVNEGSGISFTDSFLTGPVFPSSFVTFNNNASVELSGNDLLIQDTSTSGNANSFYISTTETDVVISDAYQKLTTLITGATGDDSHTIRVPLSAFTGKIIVDSAGGDDLIEVTTPSRLVEVDGGDGINHLTVNGSDALRAEQFVIRESSTATGHLEVSMPSAIFDGPYNVQATAVQTLVLNTGAGNDTVLPQDLSQLTTPLQRLTVNLGDGDDTLDGTNSSLGIEANGQDGNDTLTGGPVDDRLIGGPGDDHLVGGLGDDTYIFDADDFIGLDTITENADAGLDRLDFSATDFTTVGIDLRNTSSPQSVTTTGNLLLTLSDHIENVTGGQHGNAIIGDEGVNDLVGGDGVDYILGAGGADYIFGGGSGDVLQGSSDAQIDGGEGVDLTEVSGDHLVFPTNLLPDFDIAGTEPGTQYDQVRVAGDGQTVTLGGELAIYLNDFVPQVGDQFTIVDLEGTSSVTEGTFQHNSQPLNEGDSFVSDGQRFRISYVAGDGNDVAVTAEDTLPGLNVATSSIVPAVTENGSTEMLEVSLRARPTSNVVIDIASNDETEATVDLSQLTFTPDNWNVPQLVVITGVDDAIADGNQVSAIVLSVDLAASDSQYDSVADLEVNLITIDNDVLISGWTNNFNRFDVNRSGNVSALDALLIINELNTPKHHSPGSGSLSNLRPEGFDYFFDVSQDTRVSALDALEIINHLNAQSTGSGESIDPTLHRATTTDNHRPTPPVSESFDQVDWLSDVETVDVELLSDPAAILTESSAEEDQWQQGVDDLLSDHSFLDDENLF